jgi:hypothetical protein
VTDPLGKIAEALADLSEAEATTILSGLGAQRAPQPARAPAVCTPLPAPGECSRVRSEVEWV